MCLPMQEERFCGFDGGGVFDFGEGKAEDLHGGSLLSRLYILYCVELAHLMS